MPVSKVKRDYFEWMYQLVCEGRFSEDNPYRMLLSYLHYRPFKYRLRSDSDRANDGVMLRRRFALTTDDYHYIMDVLSSDSVSVLEVLVALAIRCEETIMSDPKFGDRTGQWFWKMIVNLGLGSMSDNMYDEEYVDNVITCFLNRKYEPNGRGGLFVIRNCNRDLRSIDIWTQMMWYLDTMI